MEKDEENKRLPVGSYTTEFARRKRWTVSEPLLDAIKYVLEDTIGVPVASDADLSVNDLGAGPGLYVKRLREWGYAAIGYDSIPQIWELSWGLVKEMDLIVERPPMSDASICIEVGEHLLERESLILLDCLAARTKMCIVASWAVPGQRGKDHINCRMPEWVAGQMMMRDWTLNEKRTIQARQICSKEYGHKLLVFVRPDSQ